MNEKKYYVKENYRFNLDSMHTHVWCLIYDIRDGKYDSVEIMGKKMDESNLLQFLDEIEELSLKAMYKVNSKEYGRIKAISDERNIIRYCTCINSGMSEDKASQAFFD